MQDREQQRDGDLWIITSFFNPMRYRRRLANYRLFREHAPLPVLAVELVFTGSFELGAGDADILIQLRGGDVMWQKERLLNVARLSLPASCRKVVWMDCDVIVGRDDWPDLVRRALNECPLVQPFSDKFHLRPDVAPDRLRDPEAALFSQPSLTLAVHKGLKMTDLYAHGLARRPGEVAAGFLWATRRELLDAHGLYDACIIGGGDTAQACAAFGAFDALTRIHRLNAHQQDYYRAWAEPYHEAIRGRVCHVDCPVFHLWHGEMANRRATARHEGLGPFGFDPAVDLACALDGPWRWNSEKPALHQYLRDYFDARHEDG